MNDTINAVFEVIGAGLLLLNVKALIKSKHIAGVTIWPTLFYSGWGVWNLFYYPSLGQWVSTLAGVLVLVANLSWLYLVWRYRG